MKSSIRVRTPVSLPDAACGDFPHLVRVVYWLTPIKQKHVKGLFLHVESRDDSYDHDAESARSLGYSIYLSVQVNCLWILSILYGIYRLCG